jgi:hypothetical protein
MRIVRWSAAFVWVLFGLLACTNPFRPGRCNQTSDCQGMADYTHDVCNLDPTPQGNGRCVPQCTTVADCAPGKICDFDSNSVGRYLDPTASDAGGMDTAGEGGVTDGGPDGGPDAHPDADICSTCGGSTPLCLSGTCVQCEMSTDCTSDLAKPICDATSHTCGPCTSDAQCTAGPGVCMAHQDGHCATDAETIYVQNTTGCLSSFRGQSGDGGPAIPYCSMDPVGAALSATKTLIVVRGTVSGPSWTYQRGAGQPETSLVGQQTAVIGSVTSPSWSMSSGTVYIRGVKFSPSATVGIKATGGLLLAQEVTVDSCQGGGILLDGAAFDIYDTTVRNNGPGNQGGFPWGGILVNSLPTTGSTQLRLVTIQGNSGPGLTCTSAITGDGVLASGNSTLDISPTCNVTACSPAATGTCGAAP